MHDEPRKMTYFLVAARAARLGSIAAAAHRITVTERKITFLCWTTKCTTYVSTYLRTYTRYLPHGHKAIAHVDRYIGGCPFTVKRKRARGLLEAIGC